MHSSLLPTRTSQRSKPDALVAWHVTRTRRRRVSTSGHEGFFKYADWINLPYDDEPWLIKPIVPQGGWVNLYGQPKKARKSYLALGASEAVASGRDSWLGFEVTRHGPVLYLQVDTPHNIWRQRVVDIAQGGYDFSNVWFSSLINIPYPFNIADHEDWLTEQVAAVPDPPVMIVYDTGRRLHTLDENSSQDMTVFMGALERASGLDAAKWLITHDKKGSDGGQSEKPKEDNEAEGGDLMKGNRGSSAVAGAVDTVIKLTPKGYMYYQGRAVGEMHKRLKFTHVHGEMGFMWQEDVDPEVEEARKLITTYKSGSERSLARLLAKSRSIDEERARAIIRREKVKGNG